MALGKLKDTWFIWALLIVATVFLFMSFKQSRSTSNSEERKIATQVHVSVPSASPAVSTAGIKPNHSEQDMKVIAAKKPVAAVVIPPQIVPPTERYAIQVHSLSERSRAETALKALKDKNYNNAYIMVSDLGPRGIWYRVRVGAFHSVAEAQKMLEKITKDFQSGIIVTE